MTFHLVIVGTDVQGRGRGLDPKVGGSTWRSWITPALIASFTLLQRRLASTCTGELKIFVQYCLFELKEEILWTTRGEIDQPGLRLPR